jgi:large subunit ribosomal protein L14
MILSGTILRVIDNSGARFAQCIKILKKHKTAKLGDKIIITIKKAIPNKKVKTHQIHTALVVRNSGWLRRKDGSYLKWVPGACVIVNKQNAPIGKRINGPVAKELRLQGHLKIISISSIAI